MGLCKFDKNIFAVAQSAYQARPKILDASNKRICWDILEKK